MKINFNQPRYAIPLIALPFLFLFFYIYQSVFAKEEIEALKNETLQDQIGEVSDDVKNRALSDKLAAYREQYRRGDGYTAIGQLHEERNDAYRYDDLYDVSEKRKLDSLENVFRLDNRGSEPARGSHDASEAALQEAISSFQKGTLPPKEVPKAVDPMELFRMQMAYADSLAKANDPEVQAAVLDNEKRENAKRFVENNPPLPVSKHSASLHSFNTIRPEKENTFIQAIVDENRTGYVDSRLRLRLLDDLLVGNRLIKRGSYLYAKVSGFSGQRVLLTISSVLQGDQILPVRLEVYDNDGSPGLYVPASAFRDFSRESGAITAQGFNSGFTSQADQQLVLGMVQRIFQSSATAISKQIRKNKAKLKYNTLVYLIDPSDLRKHQ